MAFYQIADSYVQRASGSKSAHKAFEHGEGLDGADDPSVPTLTVTTVPITLDVEAPDTIDENTEHGEWIALEDGVAVERDHEQMQVFRTDLEP